MFIVDFCNNIQSYLRPIDSHGLHTIGSDYEFVSTETPVSIDKNVSIKTPVSTETPVSIDKNVSIKTLVSTEEDMWEQMGIHNPSISLDIGIDIDGLIEIIRNNCKWTVRLLDNDKSLLNGMNNYLYRAIAIITIPVTIIVSGILIKKGSQDNCI